MQTQHSAATIRYCAELKLSFHISGDNPVMIAAKLRHKDLVSDVLRSQKFVRMDPPFLENFIHSRNKYDQTLLHMVALQGPELEEGLVGTSGSVSLRPSHLRVIFLAALRGW